MLMISVETLTTKLVASQPYSVLHKPQLFVAEKTVGMASLATHIGFQKCLWVQNVQIGSNMLNITCHKKWRSTRYVNVEMGITSMMNRGCNQTVMSQLLCADFRIVAILNYSLSSSRQKMGNQ